jgi:hypothetical protein
MRAGSTEHFRLTTKQDLNDVLKQQLQLRGIPDEYLTGIITLLVADLPTPADEAFAIRPENPAAGHSVDTWVWRIEARKPGNHKLDLKVTLTARIPSRGEVESSATISRSIAVDAGSFYLDRYWPGIAGTLAGLMGAALVWTMLRSRRAVFSHR